jgi:type I site-specific restriction-modification system R (restriction) subunit
MYVDKRLAGILAVQTMSRLNRSFPGKDTTYVLDFTNDGSGVLEAFKTYYETVQLASTTDPNLVFDLRAKLDAKWLLRRLRGRPRRCGSSLIPRPSRATSWRHWSRP